MTDSALSHIRVLDLSRILAGPWASQMLADFGAEVIKVERPGKGDDTRSWGPPWWTGTDNTRESAYFSCANRGKKSITLDISCAEGQDIIRELVSDTDILLENYKVGGLAKYGMDYNSLRKINPRLIYCSITGFGQDGPYKDRAGYDFMIQGMGGLMSVTGVPDGEPGGGPQKVGVALADIMTGLYASNACLAALAYREKTGEGQYIDLSLLDVQVATLANQAANYMASGEAPERLGNAHPNIVPYQSFAASDGHFILAVGNDDQFARLCQLLKKQQWLEEGHFRTNAERVENRKSLIAALAPEFESEPVNVWIAEMEKLGIPCGPINTIDKVFYNEQVRFRGMEQAVEHDAVGKMKLVANPIRFSASPIAQPKAPPSLGQDTQEVLSDTLGLDEKTIQKLKDDGVV